MIHFYCAVLGCRVERETSAEVGLTQLRAGEALIDLVTVDSQLGRLGGGPKTAKENNMDHFCLQLESISEDDLRAHLQLHGISASKFESRYGAEGMGNSTYVRDPEGNVVELKPALVY